MMKIVSNDFNMGNDKGFISLQSIKGITYLACLNAEISMVKVLQWCEQFSPCYLWLWSNSEQAVTISGQTGTASAVSNQQSDWHKNQHNSIIKLTFQILFSPLETENSEYEEAFMMHSSFNLVICLFLVISCHLSCVQPCSHCLAWIVHIEVNNKCGATGLLTNG